MRSRWALVVSLLLVLGACGGEGPPFVSGMAAADVTQVRVTTRQQTVVVDTLPIPGRDDQAFVAIADRVEFVETTVELLAADGTVLHRHPQR